MTQLRAFNCQYVRACECQVCREESSWVGCPHRLQGDLGVQGPESRLPGDLTLDVQSLPWSHFQSCLASRPLRLRSVFLKPQQPCRLIPYFISWLFTHRFSKQSFALRTWEQRWGWGCGGDCVLTSRLVAALWNQSSSTWSASGTRSELGAPSAWVQEPPLQQPLRPVGSHLPAAFQKGLWSMQVLALSQRHGSLILIIFASATSGKEKLNSF